MTEGEITGRGCRLRPLRRDDLPRRLEMINDPDVQRLWHGVPGDPNTLEDLQVWYHMVKEDPYSEQWAIETPDGRYVGDVDLHSIDRVRREAALSVMLGDKACWAGEFRRDVLVTTLRYALEDKGLQRITMEVPGNDEVGLRLLQELGFRIIDRIELDFIEGIEELTLALDAPDFSP